MMKGLYGELVKSKKASFSKKNVVVGKPLVFYIVLSAYSFSFWSGLEFQGSGVVTALEQHMENSEAIPLYTIKHH